jgi:hypothetical protein
MGKKRKFSAAKIAKYEALLGRVVILNTESSGQFYGIHRQLFESFEPQDIVDAILIREFALTSWEITRYDRFRTLSFDRSFKQSLEFQVQRLKSQNARKQELTTNLARHATQRPEDIAQVVRSEDKIVDLVSETDAILNRTPSELHHCHTLEKAIDFHTDVELLIASLTKRRNEALQILELRRAGLGKRVERAMNEILDAEYKVVEEPTTAVKSPPLVPSPTPTAETGKTQHRSTNSPAT